MVNELKADSVNVNIEGDKLPPKAWPILLDNLSKIQEALEKIAKLLEKE